MIDRQVGPFRIVQKIGEGGMGVVYRAHDARLGRDVALKVLPAAFAADPERMARFAREAQVLASLNHPNIASLYGLEESEDIRALVMELVDGPTLADRIAQGPVPLADAVSIAGEIARALENAHDRGIVHRDLKPANIKFAADGAVKVLDFGLAKALDTEPSSDDPHNSPTMSLAATRAGVILGTAAYMSPEQAKGKPVDKRADIWAFGVVLAEMLSGRPLFAGETVSETMAAVMKDTPAIPDAPPAIQDLLRRCLQRDPRQRMRDIGEARLVLEDPKTGEAPRHDVSSAPATASRRVGGLWWIAAAAAVVVAGAAGWWLRGAPAPAGMPLRKFAIPVEKLQAGINRAPVISPDGAKIAYLRENKLWVRDLRALAPRQIAAPGLPTNCFWSPDSSHLGFLSEGQVWKVAMSGGPPTAIAAMPAGQLGNGVGAAWRADGRVVITPALPGSGLVHVSSDGGDFTTLRAPGNGEQDYHDVSALPDGRGLLYAVDVASGLVDRIAVLAGETSKTVFHLEGESIRAPLYSPTGHIVYERTLTNAGIWAVPFALDTLEVSGEAFLVAPLGRLPSVSRDGSLVFVHADTEGPRELVWIDRTGRVVGPIGQPKPGMLEPAVSPDGRRVAVAAGEAGRRDIWVYDAVRGTASRLTFAEGDERGAAWSRSGDQLFFDMQTPSDPGRGGRAVGPGDRVIARQASDGSGQLTVVVSSAGWGPAVSRSGRFVGFQAPGADRAGTGLDLWYAELDRAAPPAMLLAGPASQTLMQFSPDGLFYAYISRESGAPEVFVKPFPSGNGKWQVSLKGGVASRWSSNGDKLFYVTDQVGGVLMEVEVATKPALTLGTPKQLFTLDALEAGRGWDVAPDGRFVFIREAPGAARESRAITVVQHWFAEFQDRRSK
jgi:Tol biopolymer transport system component